MIGNVQNTSYKQTISNAGNNVQIKEAASGKVIADMSHENRQDSVHISDNLSWIEKLKLCKNRVHAYESLSGDRSSVQRVEDLFDGVYSGNKSIEDVIAEFDSLVGKIHEFDWVLR